MLSPSISSNLIMKNLVSLFLLQVFLGVSLPAQVVPQYVYGTFRGTRVVNGHSVETLKAGELDFIISHRFGTLSGGLYEFFGLDQASIRLGLDYAPIDRVNIGIGRSSFGKHLDAFFKAQIFRQSNVWHNPVTMTVVSTVAYNTLKPSDPEIPIPDQTRLAFTNQLLIARKFGERFSLQLMPTHIHYNLVDTREERNDVFAIGGAARIQLSKNIGLTMEYYYLLPDQIQKSRYDPIAIGFDINTGGHVFQLHFTNASSMIEKGFIGQTTNNWLDGDIHFGFNMSRVFKLKGRRY